MIWFFLYNFSKQEIWFPFSYLELTFYWYKKIFSISVCFKFQLECNPSTKVSTQKLTFIAFVMNFFTLFTSTAHSCVSLFRRSSLFCPQLVYLLFQSENLSSRINRKYHFLSRFSLQIFEFKLTQNIFLDHKYLFFYFPTCFTSLATHRSRDSRVTNFL